MEHENLTDPSPTKHLCGGCSWEICSNDVRIWKFGPETLRNVSVLFVLTKTVRKAKGDSTLFYSTCYFPSEVNTSRYSHQVQTPFYTGTKCRTVRQSFLPYWKTDPHWFTIMHHIHSPLPEDFKRPGWVTVAMAGTEWLTEPIYFSVQPCRRGTDDSTGRENLYVHTEMWHIKHLQTTSRQALETRMPALQVRWGSQRRVQTEGNVINMQGLCLMLFTI